jgi:hypothetical protein|tara:strand:- start:896 stop:1027 length:132 start_codon:yes stop_codon:yes gene_type:complete
MALWMEPWDCFGDITRSFSPEMMASIVIEMKMEISRQMDQHKN